MIEVTAKLKGKQGTPLSFSKAIAREKPDGMSHADFENEAWREKTHCEEGDFENGRILIPAMAIKDMLWKTSKYLKEKESGNSTYSKYFERGILCVNQVETNKTAADLKMERLFVPSDGIKGSGKRVWKNFPYIIDWEATAVFYVIEPKLSEGKEAIGRVERYLRHAGNFCGIGRFRPERGGFYGRFDVVTFETSKVK